MSKWDNSVAAAGLWEFWEQGGVGWEVSVLQVLGTRAGHRIRGWFGSVPMSPRLPPAPWPGLSPNLDGSLILQETELEASKPCLDHQTRGRSYWEKAPIRNLLPYSPQLTQAAPGKQFQHIWEAARRQRGLGGVCVSQLSPRQLLPAHPEPRTAGSSG